MPIRNACQQGNNIISLRTQTLSTNIQTQQFTIKTNFFKTLRLSLSFIKKIIIIKSFSAVFKHTQNKDLYVNIKKQTVLPSLRYSTNTTDPYFLLATVVQVTLKKVELTSMILNPGTPKTCSNKLETEVQITLNKMKNKK